MFSTLSTAPSAAIHRRPVDTHTKTAALMNYLLWVDALFQEQVCNSRSPLWERGEHGERVLVLCLKRNKGTVLNTNQQRVITVLAADCARQAAETETIPSSIFTFIHQMHPETFWTKLIGIIFSKWDSSARRKNDKNSNTQEQRAKQCFLHACLTFCFVLGND